MLHLKCFIESFYIDIILKQNKIVEHAAAKSCDDIHNTVTFPCEKSSSASFTSSMIKRNCFVSCSI